MNYFTFPGIPASERITKNKIIRCVCEYFNTSFEKINVKTRKYEIVRIRSIIMLLLREMTGATFPYIGSIFSKDHTTIVKNLKRFNNNVEVDSVLSGQIDEIRVIIFKNSE